VSESTGRPIVSALELRVVVRVGEMRELIGDWGETSLAVAVVA
jgi:hypothetical protein